MIRTICVYTFAEELCNTGMYLGLNFTQSCIIWTFQMNKHNCAAVKLENVTSRYLWKRYFTFYLSYYKMKILITDLATL